MAAEPQRCEGPVAAASTSPDRLRANQNSRDRHGSGAGRNVEWGWAIVSKARHRPRVEMIESPCFLSDGQVNGRGWESEGSSPDTCGCRRADGDLSHPPAEARRRTK